MNFFQFSKSFELIKAFIDILVIMFFFGFIRFQKYGFIQKRT